MNSLRETAGKFSAERRSNTGNDSVESVVFGSRGVLVLPAVIAQAALLFLAAPALVAQEVAAALVRVAQAAGVVVQGAAEAAVAVLAGQGPPDPADAVLGGLDRLLRAVRGAALG
jgi:hypothetical protein